MSRARVLLLLFGLLRAGPVDAQTAPEKPAPEALTIESATEQFLSSAPRARAARARVQRAEAGVAEAKTLANPTLELEHSQLPEHSEQTAIIGFTLPLSGGRGARIDAARAGVRGAEADAHQELAQLVTRLQRTFLKVVQLQQRRAQLGTLLQDVSRLEQVARRRAELGQISGFDSLRLLSEGDLLRDKAAGLEVEAARARAELVGLLGRATPVSVTGQVQEPLALPEAAHLLELASEHGALAGTRARLEQAKHLVVAARRKAIPAPGLQGGLWRVQEDSTNDVGFVAGLSIPLTVLDRGQGERAAARAEQQVLEAEAQALETELRARIDGGLEAVRKARIRAQTFETEGMARAEQALRQAGLAYEEGEVGLPTLMEVLRTAQAAREQALEAHFEARMQELAVREAAGLIPGDETRTGGRP